MSTILAGGNMEPKQWPVLTADIPAVPGELKAYNEDFRVEEIPAYEPSGEGDHVYFGIEKNGMTTLKAVREIARTLGVKPRDIGLAGQKDSKGITRQTLSLEHADPARIEALSIPGIEVIWVNRHRNKLKTGHLRGNRFIIRIRETDTGRLEDVREILEILSTRGTPNYFGTQRFGARGDTWLIGKALLARDFEKATRLICGTPGPPDSGDVLKARQLFESGDMEAAARTWPRGYDDSARLCLALARKPGSFEKSLMQMDRRLLSLYVSALQSHLFNSVVASRLDRFGVMEVGDLAWKHDKGVIFEVEDADVENERASRGEISPSGPMYGKRMSWPKGAPGEAEARLLEESGLRLEDFPGGGPLRCTGGRRPVRFFPHDASADKGEDDRGPYLEVRFALESGCYATVVLAEICKDLLVEESGAHRSAP